MVFHIPLNTSVEPVKWIPAKSLWEKITSPASGPDVNTILITPGGTPAFSNTSIIIDAEYIWVLDGFQTTVLPINAGADGKLPAIDVKLNGVSAKKDKNASVIIGGQSDKSKGYFIQPTVIQATDPSYKTMCEEIFGPVLSVYVYEDKKFEEILDIVDSTSSYALTGAIFATDRHAVQLATTRLTHSAGNFYINDKPTGAVVGQQPFGGARKSGTNDKAGSMYNLMRWSSPRTIKENFVPPTDYRYPFMMEQ